MNSEPGLPSQAGGVATSMLCEVRSMLRSSCLRSLLTAAPAVSWFYVAADTAARSGNALRSTRGRQTRVAVVVTLAAALVPSLAATGHAQPSQAVVPFDIAEDPPRYGWKTMSVAVVLQFDNAVPRQVEIIRLARTVQDRAWHVADTGRVTLSTGAAPIEGPIGVDTLLVIRPVDRPEYLLDGPFRWPSKPATYYVRAEWRKTVRGTFSGPRGALEWIPADEQSGRVACEWRIKAEWECVGVPLHAKGVIIMITSGQVTCGIPSGLVASSGIDTAATRTSAWGRLVLVHGPSGGPPGPVRIRTRRLELPMRRESGAGLEPTLDTALHVDPIADGIVWVAGAEVTEDEWVEIDASDRLPERVDTRELTAGPADLPLRVQLRTSRTPPGRL